MASGGGQPERASGVACVLLWLRQRDGGCHGGASVERVEGRKVVADKQGQTGVDEFRRVS